MLVQAEVGSCGETGWEQGRKSSFGNEKLAGNINIFVRRVAGYLKMLWSVGISNRRPLCGHGSVYNVWRSNKSACDDSSCPVTPTWGSVMRAACRPIPAGRFGHKQVRFEHRST